MWYWILYACIAVWVFVDAKQRMNSLLGWPAATVLIGPIVLPIYFAKRNLKAGEVREGGTAWNILKNFALVWTATMAVAGFAGMMGASEAVQQATSEAEQAGAAIGTVLGLGVIFFIWFAVLVAALVLGLFLKKSSVVERGPTGPLMTSSQATLMVTTTP